MHGLTISVPDRRFLDVFRNGYVELTVLLRNGSELHSVAVEGIQRSLLRHLALVEYSVSLLRFYQALAAMLGMLGPFVLGLEVRTAQGIGLTRHPAHTDIPPGNEYYGPRFWSDERDIVIPEVQTPSLGERDELPKLLLDRLWQSFGYETAPYFSSDGKFEPPR